MTTGEFPSIDSPTFTLLEYILGQLAGAGIVPGGGTTPSPGVGELEDLLEQVKQHELTHTDLMELMIRELRKINVHLLAITNEEVDESDVETEQEP
jgi:hypothetical protein